MLGSRPCLGLHCCEVGSARTSTARPSNSPGWAGSCSMRGSCSPTRSSPEGMRTVRDLTARHEVSDATLREPPFTVQLHCQHLRQGVSPLRGEASARRWHATCSRSRRRVLLVTQRDGENGRVRAESPSGRTAAVAVVDDVTHSRRTEPVAAGEVVLLSPPVLSPHVLPRGLSWCSRRLLVGAGDQRRQRTPPGLRRAKALPIAVPSDVDRAGTPKRCGSALGDPCGERAALVDAVGARLTTSVGGGDTRNSYGRHRWRRSGSYRTCGGVRAATCGSRLDRWTRTGAAT